MKAQILRQSRKHDEDEDAREKLAGFIASKPVLLSAATPYIYYIVITDSEEKACSICRTTCH